MLIATAALAQQQSKNEFSIFVSDLGWGSSSVAGNRWTGGGGFSYNRFWTPQFSTELVVSGEHYYDYKPLYDPSGRWIGVDRSEVTTRPIDVLAQWHATTDSRWKPYLGGGFRYVQRPKGSFAGSELATELNAGVLFRMTPRLGLKFDARASTSNGASWNPSFKPSVGLSWRF